MSEIIKTKVCTKCNIEQDLSCFCKNISAKDSLQHQCKYCFKEYRQLNKEKRELYYIVNKKIIAEKHKIYKQNNKKSTAVYKKEYRIINKKAIAKYKKEWQEKNKEKIALYCKTPKFKANLKNQEYKRRSLTKQGDVTTLQLLELRQNAKSCYWCNCSLKKVKVHIDHYEPLSKGGKHTLINLVVTCSACNLTKQARDPFIFANSIGKLL